jgi:hypothetical protein
LGASTSLMHASRVARAAAEPTRSSILDLGGMMRSTRTAASNHAGRTDEDKPLPNREPGSPPPEGKLVPAAIPPLERDEELLEVLRGIGALMLLTSTRLVVARDGLERRPRTGIQSFPLGEIRQVRVERGSGPSGRVVVTAGTGQEIVSMFFEPRSLDRARELIAKARLEIARRRRPGDEAPRIRD